MPLTYIEEATANVARGAKLLDERMPDWFTKINFTVFNIQNPYSCVIAQLYGQGKYKDTMYEWGINESTLYYGFCGQMGLEDDEVTPLWQAEVHKRRIAG